MNNTQGGLNRMSDADFEQEYSTLETMTAGTPRPGMDAEDAANRQDAAVKAIWTFSQAAKHSATKNKRRRTPKATTRYCMAVGIKVTNAFSELQRQIEQCPAVMSERDFKLLKEAIGNFRVKFEVHDSKTIDDLKQMLSDTRTKEKEAELATQKAFIDKSVDEQAYLDAKDRYLDLKTWGDELAKEIRTLSPGIMRRETVPGVPSQHAQITPATGIYLRNILTPETIRRTFISLNALTSKIRSELVAFLTDEARHKDRHEVIKQIKQACIQRREAEETAKKLKEQ